VALAKTSVKAMAAWNAIEAWGTVNTAELCGFAGTSGVTDNISGTVWTEALCKAECLKYSAWPNSVPTSNTNSANYALPAGAAAIGAVGGNAVAAA